MATATYRVSTTRDGVESMNTTEINNQLRPDLHKVVETIVGLRQLAASTGFLTFREQKEILERLSSEDKSLVGRELVRREKETK